MKDFCVMPLAVTADPYVLLNAASLIIFAEDA